jgi:hypothetical protein
VTPAKVVAVYAAAWREVDETRRLALLVESCSDDVAYVDPESETLGRDELSTFIGGFLSAYPGHRLELASRVDVHHSVLRFAWRVERPDGTQLGEGIDACELAADGRLLRITGFFGAL